MAWHRPAPSSVGTKLRLWCGFLTLNESDDCPNKDASGQSWRRQWCGRAQTSSCLPWTLRRVQAGTKISVCVIFCSNPVTLHWHDCGTAVFPPRCRHIMPWRLNVYECANIRKIFLNTHCKRTKKHKCGDRIMFTDGLNRFGCLSPLSLSLTTFRPLFLSSKSIPPRPMTHYCKRDPSFRPVRKNIRVPFLHRASPFLTEKRNMYLQFFLTKFWQNIFAKEM